MLKGTGSWVLAGTQVHPLRAVRRGWTWGDFASYSLSGAPTGLPSGATAYQVPPTP